MSADLPSSEPVAPYEQQDASGEVDPSELAALIASAQVTYCAAIETATDIQQLSLMNFLR